MSDALETEVGRRGRVARFRAICLAAALMAAVAGCAKKGPDVQFVEGRVTLDGQPLGNATIGFTCTDTPGIVPAYGTTDENGVYRLTSIGGKHQQGACVGTFVVNVVKFETDAYETGEGGVPVGPPPKTRRVTPEVYGDAATSPLRATIQRGKNTGAAFDFALESKPGKSP